MTALGEYAGREFPSEEGDPRPERRRHGHHCEQRNPATVIESGISAQPTKVSAATAVSSPTGSVGAGMSS